MEKCLEATQSIVLMLKNLGGMQKAQISMVFMQMAQLIKEKITSVQVYKNLEFEMKVLSVQKLKKVPYCDNSGRSRSFSKAASSDECSFSRINKVEELEDDILDIEPEEYKWDENKKIMRPKLMFHAGSNEWTEILDPDSPGK